MRSRGIARQEKKGQPISGRLSGTSVRRRLVGGAADEWLGIVANGGWRVASGERWSAERRGQESLPFPVLPGYMPMHCLEGLLSGGRTANRTRGIYIRLHRRLLERSEFRAVWNQDADSIQSSVEIDAHAVLIKPLGCVVPPRRKRGRSTSPIIAEA